MNIYLASTMNFNDHGGNVTNPFPMILFQDLETCPSLLTWWTDAMLLESGMKKLNQYKSEMIFVN